MIESFLHLLIDWDDIIYRIFLLFLVLMDYFKFYSI
jgi:hypothetical protein